MKLKIESCSWHRNGISGIGFYAIIFMDKEYGRMVASLFDEPGFCSVYLIEELDKGNIEFARGNSWRGDEYEGALRPLVKKFLDKKGSNRIGPFSRIPANENESEGDKS